MESLDCVEYFDSVFGSAFKKVELQFAVKFYLVFLLEIVSANCWSLGFGTCGAVDTWQWDSGKYPGCPYLRKSCRLWFSWLKTIHLVVCSIKHHNCTQSMF